MLLFTLFFGALLFGAPLLAQDACDDLSPDVATVSTTRLEGIISDINGLLTYRDDEPALRYRPAVDADPVSVLFSSSLWIGGITPAGELAISAGRYHTLLSLPLGTQLTTTDPACMLYDTMWVVPRTAIDAHRSELAAAGVPIVQRPALYGYPGRNNPHFAQFNPFGLPPDEDLAPFYDANGDQVYDPDQGDYPLPADVAPEAIPTTLSWSARATATQAHFALPLAGTVYRTIFSYDCADTPSLTTTLFTQQRFVYTGSTPLDSLHMGIWTDFALGCWQDDYLGTVVDLSTVYSYNRSAVDDYACAERFAGTVPVAALTFLSHPLYGAVYTGNSSLGIVPAPYGEPHLPWQYYSLLTGSWTDGSPLTYGGFGGLGDSIVQHLFTGDPNDADQWSMRHTPLPSYYRTGVGSAYIGRLEPGESVRLDAAFSVHAGGSSHLDNVTRMFAGAAALHDAYAAGFAGSGCSVPVAAAPSPALPELRIFPNPAAGACTLSAAAPVDELRIYDLHGRSLVHLYPSRRTVSLPIDRLAPGIVVVRARSGARWTAKRLVIAK